MFKLYFIKPDRLYEECYYIEFKKDSLVYEQQVIVNTLKLLLESLNYEVDNSPFITEGYIEFGPKLNFETPWCSNIKEIFKNCDIIKRVETSKRVLKDSKIFEKEYDHMTQDVYQQPLTNFETKINPQYILHDLELNEENRIKYSIDSFVFKYYQDIFKNKRINNIELFDLAQSNSEHSRHWFFNSEITIKYYNGEYYTFPKSLFQIVKETNNQHTNSLIAFKDNASAIEGYSITKLLTNCKYTSSIYNPTHYTCHITHNAETHNFPTCLSPFPGAATGVGGRIRDTICIGKGGGFISGIAGYCVGNINNVDFDYPYYHPKKLLIEASNGASDYGNKIGEPVTQGFTRSFGMKLNDKHYEYIKPIMYSASNGYIYDHNLKKEIPKYKDLIVRVGGPAYSIGLGGGAASSQDQDENTTNFNAVQRGNPEMENKVYKFLKACFEMSDNPIISLHDQGSGGMANVTKEIVSPNGGKVFLNKVNLGQEKLSDFEIWNAEYQEQCCFITSNKPENITLLKKIAAREGVLLEFVGYIDNSQKINVYSHQSAAKFDEIQVESEEGPHEKPIVDFELAPVLEEIPKKTLTIPYYNQNDDKKRNITYKDLSIIQFKNKIYEILKDINVGSKKFLTNKVDRSVTGLIAQQQCVGPFQTPIANFSISKLSFNQKEGMVSSIGERPFYGIVNIKSMVSMTVGEMLTNLIFAKIKGLEYIKVLTNWMWSTNIKPNDYLLVDAVRILTEYLNILNIGVDGGKDSLSMNIKVNEQIVESPNTLVLKSIAPMDSIYRKVTPDLKGAGNYLILIDMGFGRMGGSIYNKLNDDLGTYDEHPTFEKIKNFEKLWIIIQNFIEEKRILSGHDRSDGGLISALVEMSISSIYGINIDINSHLDKEMYFFNEELGLVLEVTPEQYNHVLRLLYTQPYKITKIGTTTNLQEININFNKKHLFSESKTKLAEMWELPSYIMEMEQCNLQCARAEYLAIQERQSYQYYISNKLYNKMNQILIKNVKQYNVGIIRTNGTNGEYELANAFSSVGFKAFDIHMNDIIESGGKILRNFNGLAFAGGFSYSDVISSSIGWAFSILSDDKVLSEFDHFYNNNRTFSLGICNGCQLLSHINWIPKCKLLPNDSEKFESRYVNLKIISENNIFTKNMEDTVFGMWSAHGEGKFSIEEESFNSPIRYVDYENQITEKYPYNPNGSPNGVAALCSNNGRHMGIMPHPERSYINYQVPYITKNIKDTNYTPWYILFKNAFEFVSQ